MTDNVAEFAVDLDPEDLESGDEEELPSRAETRRDAADEADAFEQSREVPVDEDEYR